MSPTICIDPGVSGGWVLRDRGGLLYAGGNDSLLGIVTKYPNLVAYVEKVPPFVGRAIPSSASFKLGYSFGWCVGLCQGAGVPVHLVPPQTWQKSAGIGTKGSLSSAEWKRKLKAEAERQYPGHNVTLKTADAFLLLSHVMKGIRIDATHETQEKENV